MRPKKEINVQIGERIKKAREKRGLTQEQFAEAIDKTPQFVSDMERGVCGVSLETLRLICRKLDVSSDGLPFPEGDGDGIERIVRRLRRMTPEQLRIAEALVEALLRAAGEEEAE